jgi:aspartate aminotransferase-like enzyme
MIRKELIMTPGPTEVPPEVLQVQGEPLIHHRTPQFTEVFAEMVEGLKKILLTKNDVLVFACSGTGAMEASVTNCFSPGDKVLVAAGGKFGQRFEELTELYGLDVDRYHYPWDETLDPEVIASRLKARPDTKGVFVTHSETSTGVVNDIEAVGRVVSGTPAILVVDSISGAGAIEMRTDDWGVDVLVWGSQKAFMTPPGLAGVAVSPKAWEMVEKASLPKYYFSFTKTRKKYQSDSPETPYTPAISLVRAMSKAIEMIEAEGLEEVWRRHRILSDCTKAGVKAMGLELFPKVLDRACTVTAVKAPEGMSAGDITRTMNRKYGIILAGGQDQLKGKIFRIGHVGYYNIFDVMITLSALEMTLRELGFEFELGSGVAAAQKTYLEVTK